MLFFTRLGNFRFCTDRFRYNAAQAVLSIVFNSNLVTLLPTKKRNAMAAQFDLFNEKIFKQLDQMLKNNSIDVNTHNQLRDMFTPSKGIQLPLSISQLQQNRLLKASNQNNLIAYSLDPVMFKLVLKMMYSMNK